MEKNLENKIYADEVKKSSPNSPLFMDCARAFVSGGIICCIGQAVTEYLKYLGCTTDDANIYTSVILIIIASIMTGLGLYAKLGKFAGAGSIVPITGFSNSVTAPAIEFKTEGFILGVGAKIFTVAGPVILYGVLTSMLVGIVYYIF
jgi:stage V sporulation protein AC